MVISTWSGVTSASTFRPIALARLVEQSEVIVVAMPISAECHWATIGSVLRLVTDFTLEVDWTLQGTSVTGEDIVVRTLGGSDGNLASLVYGEAQLAIGQSSLLFLVRNRDSELHVLGMAQGHYPLQIGESGEWQIATSPGLEGVTQFQLSAAKTLSGRMLSELPGLLQTGGATP